MLTGSNHSADQHCEPQRLVYLLVLLGIVAGMGVAIWYVRVLPRQRVEALGGELRYLETHAPFALDLSKSSLDDGKLELLLRFPTLTRVSLAGRPVTDRCMDVLAKLTQLQEVDLSQTQLTGAGLRRLSQQQTLRKLTLDNCPRLVGSDFECVLAHPGLETLSVQGLRLDLDLLAKLRDRFPAGKLFVNADSLIPSTRHISPVWVTEGGVNEIRLQLHEPAPAGTLAKLPHPELVVEIDEWARTAPAPQMLHPDDWRDIARFHNLRDLSLMEQRLTDGDLTAIASLKSLQRLVCWSSSFTTTGLEALRAHPALETLSINTAKLEAAGLASIASIPHLSNLLLTVPEFTPRAWEQLAAARQLEDLSVFCPSFRDTDLVSLQAIPRLRSLDLHCERLTSDAIPILKSIPTLKLVRMSETEVSTAEIEQLNQFLAARAPPSQPATDTAPDPCP